MQLHVTLVQWAAAPGDPAANLAAGTAACRAAAAAGADVVLFPEMWQTGYAACPFDPTGQAAWEAQAIALDAPFITHFQALARALDLAIVLTFLERHAPLPRDSAVLIDRQGALALHYAKVHVCNFGLDELAKPAPDYDSVGGDYHCAPGRSFPVAPLTTREGTTMVGLMICADREFPAPAERLFRAGAEIILVPNACTWDALRAAQLRVRAFDILGGIALANYPPPLDNGGSCAYDCVAWDAQGRPRDGALLEAGAAPGLYHVTFDLDAIRGFRRLEQWRLDYRRQAAPA